MDHDHQMDTFRKAFGAEPLDVEKMWRGLNGGQSLMYASLGQDEISTLGRLSSFRQTIPTTYSLIGQVERNTEVWMLEGPILPGVIERWGLDHTFLSRLQDEMDAMAAIVREMKRMADVQRLMLKEFLGIAESAE